MSDDLNNNIPNNPATEIAETTTNESATNKEVGDWEIKANEYLAGWQRARSDYANLKKETDLKQLELIKYANVELLQELLPLVDYFKQALRAVPESMKGLAWVEGVRHIQSKLEQILAYHGIKEMEVVGEKFNPELHEAVGQVENSEQNSDIIVEEIRTGFLLHDKVLQAARVKVAK